MDPPIRMKEVSVKVKRDHLDEIVATKRPINALAELIWNAFDADASLVHVTLDRNKLDGLDRIRVIDNGLGIPFECSEEYFENIGGSWKKDKGRTPSGRRLHGKKGKGRFKAFSLGKEVIWQTVYDSGDSKKMLYTIEGSQNTLGKFRIEEPKSVENNSTGTDVQISGLHRNYTSLLDEGVARRLAEQFALYLRSYPGIEFHYDGEHVDPKQLEHRYAQFVLPSVNGDPSTLEVIEWKVKVERQLFLCDADGFALNSMSPGIQAQGFDFTAYVRSSAISRLAEQNLLDMEEMNPLLRPLLTAAKDVLRDYFRKRAAENATSLVADWKREEVYPYEGQPSNPIDEAERQVFDVVALNVNNYLPGFNKLETSSKKFSLRLLRQALAENPESLQTILQDVLELPASMRNEFACLLKRTTLAAMINASKVVTDRLDFVAGLDALVFDHKKTLLERSQLHNLIAENTWIFGEEFNLSVSDESLSKVLEKHLSLLGKRTNDDDEGKVHVEGGGIGRVDLMLARTIPQPHHEKREYLVVELKRPSKCVDSEVITQIEKYALAVAGDERFHDPNSTWNFVVVSNEIDEYARRKSRQPKRPEGLLYEDGEQPIFIWVKTWAQVLREARSRLEFFREKLSYTATHDAGLDFLRRTHAKYLPDSALKDDFVEPSEECDKV